MSVYSRVPIYKPKRNVFKGLSHEFRNTVNIGELHLSARPIECVPGDTMDLSQISTVEFQPLIHPFKGDLYYESWAFFVSNRICKYEDVYEESLSSQEPSFDEILLSAANQKDLDVPIILNAESVPSDDDPMFSYLSEVGFSTDKNRQLHAEDFKICAYPLRAIDLIYKEYFRDENLQPLDDRSYTYHFRAGHFYDNTHSPFYLGFYNVNYKKDRFTSAFTSPQKGNPINLGIGGTGKIVVKDGARLFFALGPATGTGLRLDSVSTNYIFQADSTSQSNVNAFNTKIKETIADNLKVDFENSNVILPIENVRLANKLQKWNERNQLTGTRYKEYLLANYGIAPSDETLYRPALIGHIKTPVIVNSVLQHEETSDTPLGYKAGSAGTVQSSHFGKWVCKEFGWIIVLSALRPKANYQFSLDRSLIKTSVWDFFNKQFESLGQEEIYNCEVDCNHETDANWSPLGVFGYTDRYNFMREMQGMTTGQFLQTDSPQSLPAYAVVRKWSGVPYLSHAFIEVDPSDYDYLFAVPHTSLHHAMVSTTNIIKAVRPLSKYAHPSL